MLNSYSRGNSWTDAETAGVEAVIRQESGVVLSVEYLGLQSSDLENESIVIHLRALLEGRYRTFRPDVLICTDQYALMFILRYREELFPGIPVSFCGLSRQKESMLAGHRNITGVFDDVDVIDTFRLGLELFPQTRQFILISSPAYGTSDYEATFRQAAPLFPRTDFVFFDETRMDQALAKLKAASRPSIIIPLSILHQPDGSSYTPEEAMTILSMNTPFPLMSFWDSQLGHGMLGGKLVSGRRQGELAAGLALRFLKGENPAGTGIRQESSTVYMFDQKQLDRFGIQDHQLPAGAQIINRPPPFYERNREAIWISVGVSLPLLLILVILAFNILKRHRAEQELRASEQKYRRLVEAAQDGIVVVGEDHRAVLINSQLCRLMDYPAEELLGKSVFDFVHPDDLEKVLEKVNERRAGTGDRYDLRFLRRDGSVLSATVSVSPLMDEAGVYRGSMSLVTDNSQRKRFEEEIKEANRRLEETLAKLKETQQSLLQQERLRALGQMASGIAHDINNSLVPILGYADLLLTEEDLPEALRDPLGIIRRASLDISSTLERMRDFYRQKNRLDTFTSFNLNQIVKSTLEFTRHRWKDIPESLGQVISVETELTDKLPWVAGVDSEIREALINLIFNAADAMPSGGTLTLRTFLSNRRVVLEVEDTGTGMDEQTRRRCMEPFFTTKGEKGSGLGLSMVYGTVLRHEGDMEIESSPGQGTLIRLYFPALIAIPPSGPATASPAKLPALRILCIDDDLHVLQLLEKMLANRGHRPVLKTDGKSGVDAFQRSLQTADPFQLVISDLGMPHLDGRSVTRQIKHLSAETPVILITGWGSFLDKESIREVDYLLKKPVTVGDLDQALTAVCQG